MIDYTNLIESSLRDEIITSVFNYFKGAPKIGTIQPHVSKNLSH